MLGYRILDDSFLLQYFSYNIVQQIHMLKSVTQFTVKKIKEPANLKYKTGSFSLLRPIAITSTQCTEMT